MSGVHAASPFTRVTYLGWQQLADVNLIIWGEVTMQICFAFEAVDRMLRDESDDLKHRADINPYSLFHRLVQRASFSLFGKRRPICG